MKEEEMEDKFDLLLYRMTKKQFLEWYEDYIDEDPSLPG